MGTYNILWLAAPFWGNVVKLGDYLSENDLTYTSFAPLIGVKKPETVRRYCLLPGRAYHRIPRPPIMARIATATDGQVTAADFYATPPAAAAVGPLNTEIQQ